MLLFRAEEHIDRWCETRNIKRGATLTPQQGWQLAYGWYKDKLTLEWRRHTLEEAETLLASVGLTGRFGIFEIEPLRFYTREVPCFLLHMRCCGYPIPRLIGHGRGSSKNIRSAPTSAIFLVKLIMSICFIWASSTFQ